MFLAFFFIKSYVKLFQYKDSLIKQINIIGTKNSLKMIVFNVYTFLEKIMALYGSYISWTIYLLNMQAVKSGEIGLYLVVKFSNRVPFK